VTLRRLLTWKALFYEGLLPGLRRLSPARADAALDALGRALAGRPGRRRRLESTLERSRQALGAGWDLPRTRRELSANLVRFAARDYLLDGLDDDAFAARFDVLGYEHLAAALGDGRGVVLLGCHFGGHLAAVHWLYRRGVPLRLLVQRPRHVSDDLLARFDDATAPAPQRDLFLHWRMPPGEAAGRLLHARDALRRGLAVYLNGDIPWPSDNAHPGRLLGREQHFLAIWADLAALARAPVVPVFCTHRPGGRFLIAFDAPWDLRGVRPAEAVTRYLARLEQVIANHPADAVAHLTWPAYAPADGDPGAGPSPSAVFAAPSARPGRPRPAPAPARPRRAVVGPIE
jgi:lauroyl/myristoyl acyltransferase